MKKNLKVLLLFYLSLLLIFTACAKKIDNTQKISVTKKEVVQSSTPSTTTPINSSSTIAQKILVGARKDASTKPSYKSAYYSGGYPPDNEGVCTDVIWRALKEANINLKDLVDEDIRKNTSAYPRVAGKPDPNIDFRRVPNLISFFKRHGKVLTTDLSSENLNEWKGGDIVVFGKPIDHIAIISDIKNEEDIPLMIHNGGPYTKEEDALLYWHENISPIIYHFRYPKE
ncbi:DUF1287 domain-containing protein [Anaeromicrobium sediminis]|uniref:DUF1287 domain-containing protein n=1 Tax=Anaeromicrobium sediminis TaxID=1478221 RepID=UPI001A9A5BB8|nr:DUF1287 domain-containing protein [Anaeromicrobium sediminis]